MSGGTGLAGFSGLPPVDIEVFFRFLAPLGLVGHRMRKGCLSNLESKFADLAARKLGGWFLFAGRGFTSLWQKTNVLIE
jgi:hypothetical protein